MKIANGVTLSVFSFQRLISRDVWSFLEGITAPLLFLEIYGKKDL